MMPTFHPQTLFQHQSLIHIKIERRSREQKVFCPSWKNWIYLEEKSLKTNKQKKNS